MRTEKIMAFWYSEDVSVKTNAKTNSHVGETGDNKQLIYLIVKLSNCL